MEREAFQKELAKFKVVRSDDHYKPRVKKIPTTNNKPANSQKAITNTTTSEKKAAVATTNDSTFWDLISAYSDDILTAKEKENFLKALRSNYTEITDMINLEDLNVAATMVE